jgi:hypothetical protein
MLKKPNVLGGELMGAFFRAPPPPHQPAERAGRANLIDFIGFFQTFRAWALARTLAMRFFYAEAWVAGGEAGAGVQARGEPMQNQWKKAWGNNSKNIGKPWKSMKINGNPWNSDANP